jgi:D-tagatose-1,6-bisphosphate aldolase subunit GatZ/KbaZ
MAELKGDFTSGTGSAALAGPGALLEIVAAQKRGEPRGIWSVCSAHPYVLDTALEAGRDLGVPVLVEATSNQVNQEGGYTGVTPADFAAALRRRAERASLPRDRVLFGGDHLGPHPWRREPAEAAMAKARELVRQYVEAGATKVHLDASMGLADDPGGVPTPEIAADRTADLGAAGESARREGGPPPVYVIGTEVPPPGGERDDVAGPQVTRPEDAARTLELTKAAFRARGLDEAWERVVALVVQPGVEFGDERVHEYDPAAARPLAAFIEGVPGMVYEAHSTDYQTPGDLAALVRDHFAILKVGPWLTFAFREAVFALEAIEHERLGARKGVPLSRLRETLEAVMRGDPRHWRDYYRGDETQLRFSRQFSLSDRIRYYWARPEVEKALARLLANLEAGGIPLALLSQYLPDACRAVREGRIAPRAGELIRGHIRKVVEIYVRACSGEGRAPSVSEGAPMPLT